MANIVDYIPFLTIAASVSGSLLIAWWQRGKLKADETSGISGAFSELVEDLQAENGRMRVRMGELEARLDNLTTRVNEVETENNQLREYIRILISQLRRHDIEPERAPWEQNDEPPKPPRRRRKL